MALTDFYNITATVLQWTETINELGASNKLPSTWTSVVNITLALQQLSKNERFIDGTDRIVGTHRAFTAVATAITEKHHIRIGTDEYDIEGIEDPMKLGRHYEITLKLITGLTN